MESFGLCRYDGDGEFTEVLQDSDLEYLVGAARKYSGEFGGTWWVGQDTEDYYIAFEGCIFRSGKPERKLPKKVRQ